MQVEGNELTLKTTQLTWDTLETQGGQKLNNSQDKKNTVNEVVADTSRFFITDNKLWFISILTA